MSEMREMIGPNISVKSAPEIIQEKGRATLIDDVMNVEQRVWPKEIQATVDKFESRLDIFPEGFFVAYDGNIPVGVTTAHIIDFDSSNPPSSWEETTDDGFIKNHKPGGNALYAVSVGAIPGKGYGKYLVEAQKNLTKKKKLDYFILGARFPTYRDYHRENPTVTAEQYLKKVNEKGESQDWEIRFYSRCGLKPVALKEKYMGDDPESEDYGVVMAWENPHK